MRFFLLQCVLLFGLEAHGEWPAVLLQPGVGLGYPEIGPDGNDGAFVAGTGLYHYGWDLFLFHVDSSGHSLWVPTDTVASYVGPGNQYPEELHADGAGGCVMLMRESMHVVYIRERYQVVRYDSTGNRVWQFMPFDSAADPLHWFGTLAVTHGQAVVFWHSHVPDSVGDWYTRLRVSDGVPLDTPAMQHVFLGNPRQSILRGDSLFLLGRDTVSVIDMTTGTLSVYRLWSWLPSPQMVLLGDTVVVVGTRGRYHILESVFADGQLRQDTVTYLPTDPPINSLRMIRDGDRVFVSFMRTEAIDPSDYNTFGRFYSPGTGLSDELVVCDAPGYQRCPDLVSGHLGVGMAWYDGRDSTTQLFIQHLDDGECHWPNGLQVSVIYSGDLPDACDGSTHGLVVFSWQGLRVQPIDSLPGNAVHPSDLPAASQFRLLHLYPNPFNSTLEVHFDLTQSVEVRLTLHNLLGQAVAVLAEGRFSAGVHHVSWKSDGGSGIYLVRLWTPWGVQTRKAVLLR